MSLREEPDLFQIFLTQLHLTDEDIRIFTCIFSKQGLTFSGYQEFRKRKSKKKKRRAEGRTDDKKSNSNF